MNLIRIKMKGQDEITFSECNFENADKFVVIYTLEGHHIVGAFATSSLEYVYYDHDGDKL